MAPSFLSAAEALAYLAPRPRYTAARITAATKALGLPSFRLDDAGHYGWTVWNGKGYPEAFATLADVAADLTADLAPAAPAAPAPPAPPPPHANVASPAAAAAPARVSPADGPFGQNHGPLALASRCEAPPAAVRA